MPSLSDIPPKFLFRSAKQEFINWLKALPIPVNAKSELAGIWMEFNKTRWNAQDYNNAGII